MIEPCKYCAAQGIKADAVQRKEPVQQQLIVLDSKVNPAVVVPGTACVRVSCKNGHIYATLGTE